MLEPANFISDDCGMIRSLGMLSLFAILSMTAVAREGGVKLHTPPEWRGETIALPPGFARDLEWHGAEHIRFAPGMFKPASESFFSYVLVFLLEKGDDVSAEAVQKQVLTYYRGLATAVMGGKGREVNSEDFQLKLDADDGRDMLPAEAKKEGAQVWRGTLDWVEPFATYKSQQLNVDICLWNHGDKPVLYFIVSPQERAHPIWKEMRKYRAAFEVAGE